MIKHLDLPFCTRFAPSPSGDIHLGNLRSALFSWLLCQKVKGTFVLRIEDTDSSRSDRSAVKAIVQSLRWIGIRSGSTMFQSKRVSFYCRVLKLLLILGKAHPNYEASDSDKDRHWLVKFNSRLPSIQSDLLPTFWYCCHSCLPSWSDLTKGSVRIGAQDSISPLVVRSDGMPTFNFCSAVDDFTAKTSHIIRGADHLPNTAQQISLLNSVGTCSPKYFHLPMLLDASQKKLSKRAGAKTVGHYAESGFFPSAVANYLVAAQEVTDSELSCLAKRCDFPSLGGSPVALDVRRLEQFNCLRFRNSSKTAIWDFTLAYRLRRGTNVRMLFSSSDQNFVRHTTERSQSKGQSPTEFLRGSLTFSVSCAFWFADWTKPDLTETIKTAATGQDVVLTNLCSPLRMLLSAGKSSSVLDLVLASGRHWIVRHLLWGVSFV